MLKSVKHGNKRLVLRKRWDLADMLVVLGSVMLVLFLLTKINYNFVPDSDFIDYIYHAKSYLQLENGLFIKRMPLFPVVMFLFSKFLPVQYPEVASGVIINILLFGVGLLGVWKVARKYFGGYAVILLLLLITNPLTYLVVLQPVDIVMLTTFTIGVFYFRSVNRLRSAYFLSCLAGLTRFEGIILLGVMFLFDIVNGKKLTKFIGYFVKALAPIGICLVYIHFNSPGNLYVSEIKERIKEIPSWEFLINSFAGWLVYPIQELRIQTTLTVLGLTFVGVIIYLYRKEKELLLLAMFLLAYLLFHLSFPDTSMRYSYPVLWMLGILCLWPIYLVRKTNKKWGWKYLVILICLLLPVSVRIRNLDLIRVYMSYTAYNGAENRFLGEWLSGEKLDTDVVVMTYQPWVAAYYTKNPKVQYFGEISKYINECDSLECLLQESRVDDKKLIIMLEGGAVETDEYFSYRDGRKFYIYRPQEPDVLGFRLVRSFEFAGKRFFVLRNYGG